MVLSSPHETESESTPSVGDEGRSLDDKEDTLEDASLMQGAYSNMNELFQHLDDGENFSP